MNSHSFALRNSVVSCDSDWSVAAATIRILFVFCRTVKIPYSVQPKSLLGIYRVVHYMLSSLTAMCCLLDAC